MKIRIKFTKTGALKFIGHLDVMRYFQKLIRRANIPIAYSNGLSPHQVMSFALPLGIGLESDAEYADIEITEPVLSKLAVARLNEATIDGIQILSFRRLPESAGNAMASVTAAEYQISFRDGFRPNFDAATAFTELMSRKEIIISKKTKKSVKDVDLKPFIYHYEADGDMMILRLSCGSVNNIKPELVMAALYADQNTVFDEYGLLIKRLELYTGEYPDFISLNEIGEDIECYDIKESDCTEKAEE